MLGNLVYVSSSCDRSVPCNPFESPCFRLFLSIVLWFMASYFLPGHDWCSSSTLVCQILGSLLLGTQLEIMKQLFFLRNVHCCLYAPLQQVLLLPCTLLLYCNVQLSRGPRAIVALSPLPESVLGQTCFPLTGRAIWLLW